MDSIWDSLQEDEKKVVKNYKNKKSPQVIFQVEEKDKKTKKKTGTQSANLPGVAVKKASKVKGVKAEPANVILDLDATDTAISTEIVSSVTPTLLSHSDMALKLSKDLIGCNDDSLGVRKSSLEKINQNLFVLHSMTPRDYSEILQDVSKPIFRCFGDTSEKCRALSFQITKQFFERASDIQPVLPYFMPSLMQRLPTGLGYDDDLKVIIVFCISIVCTSVCAMHMCMCAYCSSDDDLEGCLLLVVMCISHYLYMSTLLIYRSTCCIMILL